MLRVLIVSAAMIPALGGLKPPAFEPALVKPDTVKYSQKMKVMGREITVTITRSIKQILLGSASAWQVVDLVTSPMGQGSDTLDIDASSLMPIRRSGRQGPQSIQLTFSSAAIRGSISSGAMSMPVDLKPAGLTLPDGAGLEVPLATLPLKEGYATSFGLIDLMKMKIEPVTVTVTGLEKVTIAAAPQEAYRVEMVPDDDPATSQTFWIAKGSRRLIKSEARLPAAMGGGTAVSEMVTN